jgi:hypothetical protein
VRRVLARLGLPDNLFAFDTDHQVVVDEPVRTRLFARLLDPVVLVEHGVADPVLFVDV